MLLLQLSATIAHGVLCECVLMQAPADDTAAAGGAGKKPDDKKAGAKPGAAAPAAAAPAAKKGGAPAAAAPDTTTSEPPKKTEAELEAAKQRNADESLALAVEAWCLVARSALEVGQLKVAQRAAASAVNLIPTSQARREVCQ